MIGDPPVGGISRIILFNKVHTGKIRVLENLHVPEMIILPQLRAGEGAANHCLEYQTSSDLLNDLVKREQGIAQMVKNSHKQDEIELPRNCIHVIDGAFGKFDVQLQHLRGKARLLQVTVVHIDAKNAAGASL